MNPYNHNSKDAYIALGVTPAEASMVESKLGNAVIDSLPVSNAGRTGTFRLSKAVESIEKILLDSTAEDKDLVVRIVALNLALQCKERIEAAIKLYEAEEEEEDFTSSTSIN